MLGLIKLLYCSVEVGRGWREGMMGGDYRVDELDSGNWMLDDDVMSVVFCLLLDVVL